MTRLKELFKKNTDFQGEEKGTESKDVVNVPEGLFVKCPKCSQPVYKGDVVAHSYCCPKCGGYFRIKAKTRIKMVTDYHSFEPWFADMEISDPLNYPDYPEKIDELKEKTHLDEAIRIGKATIEGIEVVIGVMDSRFLMGSMGYVVGEKITASFERAIENKLPVILFCCSGGARMQEGMISLMQMAKTSAAIKRHSKAGLLYVPVLTEPTMGGVTASFAMLGDVILAEPQALIGFAGPRVIAQTIGQKLPEGFQRAEFLLEHGMVDEVVAREDLKNTLSRMIRLHCKEKEAYIVSAAARYEKNQKKISDKLTAWERVQIARGKERPTSLDYIHELFDEFTELHGDRAFRDDGAIVGGVAWFEGKPVTVIGVQKGKNTEENVKRNFGMPSPEGYRKALRLMRQAEKFHRPVITFVDTPGAFCGIEAEERGQGEAIARNLMEMSDMEIPILSIVIGEGGSGGALALAVGNEVWMMENSTYSILSPEGFASILWKDSKRANEAAEVMKITAQDLKDMEVIDRIIPEPETVTIQNIDTIIFSMREQMREFIDIYGQKTVNQIVFERYERFRRM